MLALPLLPLIYIALTIFASAVSASSSDFVARVHSDVSVRALVANTYSGSEPRPLLIYLHGFCLSDDAQQALELTSMREVPAVRNKIGVARRRSQTLVQVGLREASMAQNWVYVAPKAPRSTRECVLCNVVERSPNSADRLFGGWMNGILQRDSPEFECPAWDGSDSVALAEVAATDDSDIHFIEEIINATKKQFDIDETRIYVVGIATGGFMASRLACERPRLFRGVVSFAGGTFKDPSRCRPTTGKTSVLFIHGTDDHTVPIAGGVNSRGVEFPSSDESFEIMGDAMGCTNVVVQEESSLPVDGIGLPEVVVRKKKFAECERDVKVEQWRLNGVDHFLERPTSEAMFEDAVEWLHALG